MGSWTHYLKNLVADHRFRGATWAKPTANWWALFTEAPNDDPGTGIECAGGNYGRVALHPSDSNYFATQGGIVGPSTGNTGSTPNAITIMFLTPTTDWGTIVAIGVFDAQVGGNLYEWAPLSQPILVTAGDSPCSFPPSSLNPKLIATL
jgi:hypothetical protein